MENGENGIVNAVIAVLLTMVGAGVVINTLFRLRDWLNRPVPRTEDQEPTDPTW